MDCLLLHVPRQRDEGPPEVFILPSGIFSLADALDRAGFRTRILHLGVKQRREPDFSLSAALEETRPAVVALPLHWHQQATAVLQVAADVRRVLPGAGIVLGGYTASGFAREILEEYPAVDAIVRGDGEWPLARYVAWRLRGEGEPTDVPNLVWRRPDGRVRENPVAWHCTKANTRETSHARLALLEDAADYLAGPFHFDDRLHQGGTFFYTPGRGCAVNCSFCGGGAKAQRHMTDRRGWFFFPVDKAQRDLAELWTHGVRTLRVSFDPDRQRRFYRRLFAAEARTDRRFRWVFECWSLPDADFLDRFAAGSAPGSSLILSATCGSERVRRRNGGFPFTNEALLETVTALHERGLPCRISFTCGLPFETEDDIVETERLLRACTRRGAICDVDEIQLDPFSPLWLAPERFGVTPGQVHFADFCLAPDAERRPRYRTARLSEDEILALRDRLRRVAREGGAETETGAGAESVTVFRDRDLDRDRDRDRRDEGGSEGALGRELRALLGPRFSPGLPLWQGWRWASLSSEEDEATLVATHEARDASLSVLVRRRGSGEPCFTRTSRFEISHRPAETAGTEAASAADEQEFLRVFTGLLARLE